MSASELTDLADLILAEWVRTKRITKYEQERRWGEWAQTALVAADVVLPLIGANLPNERMTKVLSDVADERARQIAKWGGRDADGVENPNQSNGVRLRVLVEEVGEVAEAMGRPEDGNGTRDLRTELVQVAAVAVAWLEAIED